MTMAEMIDVAGHLAKSGYFRDASDVSKAVAKILYGREIGIGPMAAMMGVHIIEGKPAPSAGLIASLVQRSGRYRYDIEESSNTACTLLWFRDGEPIGASSFDIEDAKRAGVAQKAVWKSYPSDMLFARALTQGARRYCPDVFLGAVYVPEELGEGELRLDRAADAPRAAGQAADPDTVDGAYQEVPVEREPYDYKPELAKARTIAEVKALVKVFNREMDGQPDYWQAVGDCIFAMLDMADNAAELAEVSAVYAWARDKLTSDYQAGIESALESLGGEYGADVPAGAQLDFDPNTVLVKAAHWQAAGMIPIPPEAITKAGGPGKVTLGTLLEIGCSKELAALAGMPAGKDETFAHQAGAVLAVLEEETLAAGQS